MYGIQEMCATVTTGERSLQKMVMLTQQAVQKQTALTLRNKSTFSEDR